VKKKEGEMKKGHGSSIINRYLNCDHEVMCYL